MWIRRYGTEIFNVYYINVNIAQTLASSALLARLTLKLCFSSFFKSKDKAKFKLKLCPQKEEKHNFKLNLASRAELARV